MQDVSPVAIPFKPTGDLTVDESPLLTTWQLGVPGKKVRSWVRRGLCQPTRRTPDGSWRWDADAVAKVHLVRDVVAAKAAATKLLRQLARKTVTAK
jgi:hypothetical protein